MPLLEARSQLAAKVESTEGTAETLSATDAVLARAVTYDPDIEVEELDLQSSSLSPFAGAAGGRMARMTFECELKGSGTAGTPPEIGKLIRACGFEETIVGGTSVTYDPASDSIPSLTIAKYVDGKRYLMAGARGNFEIRLAAGKPGIIAFDFLGTAIADSDTSLLSGVSYHSTRAQPFQNASFQIDSYSAIVEAITIATGNTVELRESVNAAQGYLSAVLSKRLMTMSLNPEDVLIATQDFWDDWESGALVAFTATLGATEGNICTITAPKVQYVKLGQGERRGMAIYEMDCVLRRDSGDDEISIAFT
ncbi:MAG: hypothetical protein JRJ66_01450 [Deltaproteobacteria bacterium]|nr:hypothetical protein [Deltaproteobacteria bacterium]MBW2081689.1 hypothetical protein [Deltaproteobacteria bacterium]MBW2298884.1 hypothetical protein [Deltaproteobacteria bacterium]